MPHIDNQLSTDSPLRRSSRTAAVNAGTPSSVKTRRASLLAQENETDSDGKNATRTRRATSITKEEKPEPAKTRSRRSSANSEVSAIEEKRQPTIKGRRSSVTDQPSELSKDDVNTEDNTTRKTIRTRRTSAAEETNQEDSAATTKGRTTKGRRLSVEKTEDVTVEPPKRATRSTRRNSVDNVEGEPEQKIAKPSTPKKPKRRLSVTEAIVPMAPITEQDAEVSKRRSKSPIECNVVDESLPVTKGSEKTNLDLSIINETEVESSPKTSKSPSDEAQHSSKDSKKIILTPIKIKEQQKSVKELTVIIEESQAGTPKSELVPAEDKLLGLRKVSPVNRKAVTPQKLTFSEGSDTTAVNQRSATENVDEDDDVFVDTPTSFTSLKCKSDTAVESPNSSQSILNSSSLKTSCSQDDAEDEINLNISNVSDGSDKENLAAGNVALGENSVPASETVKVARISDVFKPRNIENSFVEPMEVDETFSTIENEDNSSKPTESKDKTALADTHDKNQSKDDGNIETSNNQKSETMEFFSAVADVPEKGTNRKADECEEQVTDQSEADSNGKIEKLENKDGKNSAEVVTTIPEPAVNGSKVNNAKDTEIESSMSTNKNEISQDFDFDVPSDEENDDDEDKAAKISEQTVSVSLAENEGDKMAVDFAADESTEQIKEEPNAEIISSVDDSLKDVETEEKSDETETVKNFEPIREQITVEETGVSTENKVIEDPNKHSEELNTSVISEKKTNEIDTDKEMNANLKKTIVGPKISSPKDSDLTKEVTNDKIEIALKEHLMENNTETPPDETKEAKESVIEENVMDEIKQRKYSSKTHVSISDDEKDNVNENKEDNVNENKEDNVNENKEDNVNENKKDNVNESESEIPVKTESGQITIDEEKVMEENTTQEMKQRKKPSKAHISISDDDENEKDNVNKKVDENEKNNSVKTEDEFSVRTETESDQISVDADSSIIEITVTAESRTVVEKIVKPTVTEQKENTVDLEIEVDENKQESEVAESADVSADIKADASVEIVDTEDAGVDDEETKTSKPKENVSVCEETSEPEQITIKKKNKRKSLLEESEGNQNESESNEKPNTKKKYRKLYTPKSNDSANDVLVVEIESPEEERESTNSKLDKYLNEKIREMDEEEINEEESEDENSGFIDDMAEEGEEDTPSENSNDIIDEGESIHTESESSEDEYDSDDSFICDEEKIELLSGDEYDLDNSVKPKRKRIINIDNCDDDVIKLPLRKKKGKSSKLKKSENREKHSGEEESVEIVENVAVESDSVQPNNVVKKSAITIHENISVGDIQDPVLSKRINDIVDSFSRSINEGDVSISLTMEYDGQKSNASSDVICIDDSKDTSLAKSKKKLRRKSEQMVGASPNKKPRLSVSLNSSQDSTSTEEKSHSMNRRKSVSSEDLHLQKINKKKSKQAKRKLKNDLLREVGEKSIRKNLSTQDLRKETFNIMNHLITDIMNRPRRTVKPSSSKHDESWAEDTIEQLKPSTSMVSKKDIEEFQAKKIHKKDFKSQMLSDPSRIKRVETKKILKKKGVHL